MSLGFDADPTEVAQDLLDRSGEALMTGDFGLMRPCFLLPQGFSTFDGERMAETEEDLESVFRDVRDEFARRGVTQIIRTIVAASRVSDTQITSTHMSHLMAGNTRLNTPYPVYATTRWTGTDWRVASNEYAVEPGSNHSRALGGAAPKSLQTGANT